MKTPYDPADWQARHPIGTRMIYVGLDERSHIPVKVGKAHRTGVRVKYHGQWHTLHPDDLRPT